MAPSLPASAPVRRNPSSRKRKPSAKAEHDPEPLSGAERPRKMASSGQKPPVKAKPAKAPPRKRKVRAGAQEGDAEKLVENDVCADEPDEEVLTLTLYEENELAEQEEEEEEEGEEGAKRRVAKPSRVRGTGDREPEFVGEPVPRDEALKAWPNRYRRKRGESDDEELKKARTHYRSAKVEDTIYCLNDDVFVQAGEGEAHFIGRITEFFEGIDRRRYFTCRWFFRTEDTVILPMILESSTDHRHDPKRVFLSDEKNDNSLDCIISKIKIVHVDPNMNSRAKAEKVEDSHFYYDMSYSVAYSTFANIPSENMAIISDTTYEVSSDNVDLEEISARKVSLLDLYSGCGGMSTGLCLGAALAGVKLETRWAVDFNEFACESLKYNHPNTEVRNEKVDDFLALLRQWAVLCDQYVNNAVHSDSADPSEDEGKDKEPLGEGEYVVEKLTDICYGGTGRENAIYFKVQWDGYGPEEDSWEPIQNLSDCPLKIKEFVQEGHRRKILPLPGNVDVICGGPPCQGISGFNGYRNGAEPLKDEKNRQLVTFMDVVEFLKPKYVLMENVGDILKFAGGYLARYALSRLVSLDYQARLGMMVAGCYGLPQFRMRVFLWGALPSMVLPKYPLPTHNVVVRGGIPNAFSQSIVAYNEKEKPTLKDALLLGDAIRDLPVIGNDQPNEIMAYGCKPKTDFQCYIRLSRKDMLDYSYGEKVWEEEGKLLDHQPLQLNNDDLARVQLIPKEKRANFRNLRGVRVGAKNVVEFDPKIERVYLDSGKPLVPDYAMSFIKGKSLKPFGRLWWDETVPTVVTRAEPHNQAILHPGQDRVLSVRENARLQGFPDYYRMYGPIKEKYIQVGNAVAVPVARVLGYSLGQAYQGVSEGLDPSLFVLPDSFTSLGQAAVPARASPVNVPAPAGEVVE